MALTSTDDTPVVSLSSDADPSYTEQADPVAIDDDLTITDADDTDLEGATVTIGAGRATGDTLSFTPVDGITGDYTADDGTLELTGTASLGRLPVRPAKHQVRQRSRRPVGREADDQLRGRRRDGRPAPPSAAT